MSTVDSHWWWKVRQPKNDIVTTEPHCHDVKPYSLTCLSFMFLLYFRWFVPDINPYTGKEDWLFNGEYWRRDWSRCPQIFWADRTGHIGWARTHTAAFARLLIPNCRAVSCRPRSSTLCFLTAPVCRCDLSCTVLVAVKLLPYAFPFQLTFRLFKKKFRFTFWIFPRLVHIPLVTVK